ncbi:uncharacterized protein LOC123310153 [Coccinella septempunctata]|uniref:uncharacterized protein LOC123310153 n=1 Tax=Coccinella septempunctata TaxID=41139 RepID=UPI001D08B575|nr:uncharacterized protein LOC123310153 [Coccinella septempunctata]
MKIKPPKEQVFSPIKWQREQKLLKSMRLVNDRNALQVLNREDIIAYRLPLHEAILRKLNRNGFYSSAEYLRQLIDFQDAYRMAAGEESIIWQRPRLMYQQNLLEHLAEKLQQAEQANTAKHTDVEIDILLNIAIEFCFGSENWWWLGHQILFITLKTCEEYEEDRGKRKALLRYIFGKFLFENAKEPRMALEHLKIARKISAEMSWNVNILFPENSSTIFSQACTLIHKIIMIQARSISQKDPTNTIKLCDKARIRALEGCYYDGVIDSYILKGNCEIMLFDTENAIKSFKRGLNVLEKHDNVDLRCETWKNLAIAYLKHGTLNSALVTLHKLNDFANQNNKVHYIAQAHKYLGEFYLREGTARNATPLLMAAVKIFTQAGDTAETAKTRNMAAISVGIELMPIFTGIIKSSEPKFSSEHREALAKLIRWKDSRESFWKHSEASQFSAVSTHTMENFTVLSGSEIEMPLTDDLDFEVLLGITGLDTGYSMQCSISNMTDVVSVSGVEKSGNTLMAPVNMHEDAGTNTMSVREKGTASLSEYVTNIKENKSNLTNNSLEGQLE